MSRPRVLICEPNAEGYAEAFGVVVPYVWAILKSYWEHYGSDPDAFTWLDPIFHRSSAMEELELHREQPPDIVGLSCYTWNWRFQCEIAQWAKKANPNCLVVVGGPDPDYKDADFFRKHHYIDAIVVKDGEIPFTAILEAELRNDRGALRAIPGLYLPSTGTALPLLGDSRPPHFFTGPAQVPATFDYSPYLEQSAMFERIAATHKKVTVPWETNRGCPYGCTFCDWGSSTMSKLRKFDMARVEAEADWIGRIGASWVFHADANLGILPRDTEVLRLLAAARAKYGYPKFMYYSSAKNNPERVVEIAKLSYAAGFTLYHSLAVQHTDPGVLAAIERSNIPAAKYREVVRDLTAAGVPLETQLILGNPGDTVEKWKRCLAEVMEWGAHDSYQVYYFNLLPNAPAAEPQYLRKWKIELIERAQCPMGGFRVKTAPVTAKNKIIVATSTFNREDWMEMAVYSWFIKALHSRAALRLPILYLRFAHNVPYHESYGAVIDEFCSESLFGGELYRKVRAQYQELLCNPDATDEMEIEDLPGYPLVLHPAKWLFYMICRRRTEFYHDIRNFLCQRFPKAANLRSAIDYQENLLITPDYRPAEGKTFTINRDWPAFFQKALTLTEYEPLEEPAAFLLRRTVEVCDREIPGDPNSLDCNGEWTRWVGQLLLKPNSAKYCNFSRLRVHRNLVGWRTGPVAAVAAN
jgi:putative methyltransferase